MSSQAIPTPTDCCSPCDQIQTVAIPGPSGDDGTNGADGAAGVNSFTVTTAGFTVPAVNANVTISVADSTWMVVGQVIFIQNAGYYEVVSKPTTTSVTAKNLGYTGNAAPAAVIGMLQLVGPGGLKGVDGSAASVTLDDLSPSSNKGDLLVDNGSANPNAAVVVLSVGANGTQLQAQSGQATGLLWTKNLEADRILHGSETIAFAATTDLNFNNKTYQTITLTANIIFTTSNKADGKHLIARLIADAGGPWTFTFPAGWIFVGAAAPASIAANKTALLELHCFGAADTNVVARFIVEP